MKQIEIKFRYWDRFYKTMNQCDVQWVDYLSKFFIEHDDCLRAENEPVLMEYTGVKDHKGIEVYEGDIVNHDSTIWPCVIIYKCKTCRFMAKEENGTGNRKEWQVSTKKIISVQGNIWENPELIKATEKQKG